MMRHHTLISPYFRPLYPGKFPVFFRIYLISPLYTQLNHICAGETQRKSPLQWYYHQRSTLSLVKTCSLDTIPLHLYIDLYVCIGSFYITIFYHVIDPISKSPCYPTISPYYPINDASYHIFLNHMLLSHPISKSSPDPWIFPRFRPPLSHPGTGEFALPRANAGEHLRCEGQDAGAGDLQKADGRQEVLGGRGWENPKKIWWFSYGSFRSFHKWWYPKKDHL